ncbi:unnamed protein product [Orchesella dallaii]|uniref:Uncharacterized protein n=1 Tax=Orchesella dallaii TaxID=48710 RepID=A0ABP1PUB9_9HEXA
MEREWDRDRSRHVAELKIRARVRPISSTFICTILLHSNLINHIVQTQTQEIRVKECTSSFASSAVFGEKNKMTNLWILSGVLLCILISGVCSYPSPLQKNSEDDEDEVDSDEEDTDNVRNAVTNSLGNGAGNLTDAELAEKASKFLAQYIAKTGGDTTGGLPLLQVPNQNRTIIIALVDGNSNNVSQLEQNPTREPFLSPDAYPFLFPTASGPELVGDLGIHRQRQRVTPSPVHVAPTSLPFYVAPTNLPSYLAATSPPIYAVPNPALPLFPTAPSVTPASENQVGVDNIEDAILEALLVAQDTSTLPSISPAQVQQIQQFQLPTGAFNPIYNLSALGLFPNNQSFLPTNPGFQAFLLNPYIPPAPTQSVPTGANPQLFAIANLFGSLAQGNLVGVVQNSLKLAGTGVLHNIANSVNCQLFQHCDSRLPIFKI